MIIPRRPMTLWFIVLLALFFGSSRPCSAITLITPEEAARPDSPAIHSRGINSLQTKGNGPAIKVLAPRTDQVIHTPLSLDVAFEAPPNKTIDYDTLRVDYLKLVSINITDRLKPYLKNNRLTLNDVDIPSGTHRLRMSIAYASGEKTIMDIVLSIADKE